jgi:uncharacterized protein YacL
MVIFKDISHFNNINDYLPILNGALNADLCIIFLSFHGIFNSYFLKKWYKVFNLSAVIADVLILVIGIIIARFLYKFLFEKWSIFYFTFLAVCVQIIHDILFYIFFSHVKVKYSFILDFFKKYANEVSYKAILGDSLMMILSCLFSSLFATYNINSNIIILIISVYLIPYVIYM